MTYRVEVIETVRRAGYVQIEAASADEARETVQKFRNAGQQRALNVIYTGATELGGLAVTNVSEAAA